MGRSFFIYAHVFRDTTRAQNKALVYSGCSPHNQGVISGKDSNPHHLTLVTHGIHGYKGALSAGSEWLDWKCSLSPSPLSLPHPPIIIIL